MVQIHGPSRKDLLKESLGQTLGQGLANFTNTYFAGKALDKTLNNPEYEDAPLSKRSSMLEQAMRPYGEYGEQTLKSRIGIEQQVQQEKEQKKQMDLEKKKSAVFAKSIKNEPLTPEEELLLSPEEHLAVAKHKQALDIASLKKPAVQIYNQTPLDKSLLPTNLKYIQKNQEKASAAKEIKNQLPILKQSIENLKDRGVGSYVKQAASNIPGISKVVDQTMNENEQAISTTVKNALLGLADTKGLRLTDQKLQWLTNAYPSPFKNYEANKKGYEILEKTIQYLENIGNAQQELLQEFQQTGQGIPANFPEIMEEKLKPIADDFDKLTSEARSLDIQEDEGSTPETDEFVIILSPQGKQKRIPKNQVNAAIKAGGKIKK